MRADVNMQHPWPVKQYDCENRNKEDSEMRECVQDSMKGMHLIVVISTCWHVLCTYKFSAHNPESSTYGKTMKRELIVNIKPTLRDFQRLG